MHVGPKTPKRIDPDEAKSWRIAMEVLAEKPGVFDNERRPDLLRFSQSGMMAETETLRDSSCSAKTSIEGLVEQIRTAKQVTICRKQPLPKHPLKSLTDCLSGGLHPTIEIVVEDLSDAGYLRELNSAGFALFYGVGLPLRSVILLDSRQGFVCEDNMAEPGFRSLSSKDAEDLYYKLRWCRFGHAVLLSGVVKEKDSNSRLFCLTTEGGREFWCRFKEPQSSDIPETGRTIEVFGWEKWLSRILEVFEIKELGVLVCHP